MQNIDNELMELIHTIDYDRHITILNELKELTLQI